MLILVCYYLGHHFCFFYVVLNTDSSHLLVIALYIRFCSVVLSLLLSLIVMLSTELKYLNPNTITLVLAILRRQTQQLSFLWYKSPRSFGNIQKEIQINWRNFLNNSNVSWINIFFALVFSSVRRMKNTSSPKTSENNCYKRTRKVHNSLLYTKEEAHIWKGMKRFFKLIKSK